MLSCSRSPLPRSHSRSSAIVWSLSNVTPPVFTVTSDVSPSAIVAADTSTVNSVASFAEIVTSLLPITVESWLASTVIVSAPSTTVSSTP